MKHDKYKVCNLFHGKYLETEGISINNFFNSSIINPKETAMLLKLAYNTKSTSKNIVQQIT